MFVACHTGATHSTYGNLVDEARTKGALCCVGWKDTIPTAGANEWVEQFFKGCSAGKNADSAMISADRWIETNSASYSDAMENRYIGSSRFGALNLG